MTHSNSVRHLLKYNQPHLQATGTESLSLLPTLSSLSQMKIAVLADIHGNLPALEAVAAHVEAWQPDRVIVAGDLVNRGPRPLECL